MKLEIDIELDGYVKLGDGKPSFALVTAERSWLGLGA